MTVDTDVHHGNGTAAIFANDASVFTTLPPSRKQLSVPKPPSDQISALRMHGRRGISGRSGKGFDSFPQDDDSRLDFLCGRGRTRNREDQLAGWPCRWKVCRSAIGCGVSNSHGGAESSSVHDGGATARRIAERVRIHVNTIISARGVVLQQASAAGSQARLIPINIICS